MTIYPLKREFSHVFKSPYSVLIKGEIDAGATMVKVIDNILVKLEFDRKELEKDKSRPFLYAGIGLCLVVSLVFFPLAIAEFVS